MEFLAMSGSDFQAHMAATGDATPVDKVTVGAAIVRYDVPDPCILLLKRNSNEEYYPNMFEIPGGKVEETDLTILDALIREVAEETGLNVIDVYCPLSQLKYTTEKTEKSPTGQVQVIKRHALQLNYIVRVAGTDFQINKEEHSTGVWASRGELDEMLITSDMGALVLEAMRLG